MAVPQWMTLRMLREQHRRICDAIRQRQPDDARQAVLTHIDFTRSERARRED